jgi:hypothetical protein
MRTSNPHGESNGFRSRSATTSASTGSEEVERSRRRNAEERRAFGKRWADYVPTHDDEEWSRRQNMPIDARLETATEVARHGDTNPVAFVEARDRHRTHPRRGIETHRNRTSCEGVR